MRKVKRKKNRTITMILNNKHNEIHLILKINTNTRTEL